MCHQHASTAEPISHRFAEVPAFPPQGAAEQAEEGQAHCGAAGGKHRLDDADNNEGYPQDESGALVEGRRRKRQPEVSEKKT